MIVSKVANGGKKVQLCGNSISSEDCVDEQTFEQRIDHNSSEFGFIHCSSRYLKEFIYSINGLFFKSFVLLCCNDSNGTLIRSQTIQTNCYAKAFHVIGIGSC